MSVAAGESSPRKLFGVIDLVGPLGVGRALFLVSLGVAIVLLEQAFRWPLQLPGHHGLEAMALLVLGRLCCTNPWSATLVGASAAVTAPFAADAIGQHRLDLVPSHPSPNTFRGSPPASVPSTAGPTPRS